MWAVPLASVDGATHGEHVARVCHATPHRPIACPFAAFMVECLTDKRTRTGPAMRHIFTKYGGDLGASGSVAWQFQQTGVITVDLKPQPDGASIDEDTLLTVALDAGATDVKVDEEEKVAEVLCSVQQTHSVKQALVAAKAPVTSSAITRFASVRLAASALTLSCGGEVFWRGRGDRWGRCSSSLSAGVLLSSDAEPG